MSVSWCHTWSQPGLSHSNAAEKTTPDSVPSSNSRLFSVLRLQVGWFGLGLVMIWSRSSLPASCGFWSHPGPALSVLNWMSNRALHVPNKPLHGLYLPVYFPKQSVWPNPMYINEVGSYTPLPVGGSVESQGMEAGEGEEWLTRIQSAVAPKRESDERR